MYSVRGWLKLEDQKLSSLVDKPAMEAKIINVAIPGDARVKDKEMEKIGKCQLLREEIRKLWKLKKANVVPVVIRALGAVCVLFDTRMEKLGGTITLEVIQKTALFGTVRLLRNICPFREAGEDSLGAFTN